MTEVRDGSVLGALVLAAGASTRMGRPKAFVSWRGATFLELVVAQAITAGCGPVLVIQGEATLPTLPRARIVDNREWRSGQLGSLQAGIRSLREDRAHVDGLLVLTVDRPAVRPATVAALAQAWRGSPEQVWQPAFEGRRGHPIIYPGDLLDSLLALRPASSARELVRSDSVRDRRRALAVDDPGVLLNIDTPEDLRRLGA